MNEKISEDSNNENNYEMPIPMKANESENNENIDHQNSDESSGKNQLKEDSHEGKSLWDVPRFPHK